MKKIRTFENLNEYYRRKKEELQKSAKESFYVVIPTYILQDRKLSQSAKIIYGEITALSNKQGYCYASNEYLKEKLKISKKTIERALKKLEKRGYIKREIKKDNTGTRRKIYLKFPCTPPK